MGLKDKLKGAWKRVSELDNGEESAKMAKDQGRIPYKAISQKLKEVMKQNVDVVGRQIIIPSYYLIFFNEADRKARIEVEEVLCEELKEELHHEMRKIKPEQNKREVIIQVETDASLAEGQFRVEHHIKKPEAETKIIQAEKAVPAVEPDEENDIRQTVIEQPLPISAEDEPQTVVQKLNRTLYTLWIDSGEETREIGISKETISIGRGSKDDVQLSSPDYAISRMHATLAFAHGSYTLTALGINGTFLNGQELELNKPVALAAGDEIKIMNYRIKIVA